MNAFETILDIMIRPWYTRCRITTYAGSENGMTAPAYNFGLLTTSGERLL